MTAGKTQTTTTTPTTTTTNTTTNTNNTYSNNNDNNNNNDNKTSQEPSLNSSGLDSNSPESNSDLDNSSLSSFNPMGVETSLVQNQLGAASSLGNQQLMTIGLSFRSFEQDEAPESFEQEGQGVSNSERENFGTQRPKKKVSFDELNVAYLKQQQNNRRQRNSQLDQREYNNEEQDELQEDSAQRKPTQTCWNSFQQELCQPINSFGLGIGAKNTAAYGIMLDTGAGISLAPMDFAQHLELDPLESTLALRSASGTPIEAFGTRTVQLQGSQLCLDVTFVIADVEQALLGMNVIFENQLSLIRDDLDEYHLVNNEGARTQLQTRGQHLYLEACPEKPEFSTFRGSNFPVLESLLNDKVRTQEKEPSASGGACSPRFVPEKLRQQQSKNTAALGTTASHAQGANTKPSASKASQTDSAVESLEQKGQKPTASELRSLEKTSLIKEIELAVGEKNQESLDSIDLNELSLRILLILSLKHRWLITTLSTTTACSTEALGQQLKYIGLEQHQLDSNIFFGDELVLLLHEHSFLIGGTESQQECFFGELSARVAVDSPIKLTQDTPVSFQNKTMEYNEVSNSISLSVPTAFYMNLLQKHDLEKMDCTISLEEEELLNTASEQDLALEAEKKELYKRTVGDLQWLASACRPDISFEAHSLAQSLDSPTRGQEKQLRKVLGYLSGTLHSSLSLHITTAKSPKEEPQIELVAFSSTSWLEALKPVSTAYLSLWGACLTVPCRTCSAQHQEKAELEGVRFALGLASHTKSFLQQLDMENFGKDVHTSLRLSNWIQEPELGRPLAHQLGLSRRHRHLELEGQLRISKVHPTKNLAHSLSNNASTRMVLAKPRIEKEAAETLALSAVLDFGSASFLSSSSFFVGRVAFVEPSLMASQLRQLASMKKSCNESLQTSLQSLTLESLSLQSRDEQSLTLHSLSGTVDSLNLQSLSFIRWIADSLNLHSLSQTKDRPSSLTWHSLSFRGWNSQSLTLQSLSLIDQDSFQRMSSEELSFENGSENELEKILAHNKLEWRAGTNSFSNKSFAQRMHAQEVETNNFFHSFSSWILSLRACLRIFLLGIFMVVCAALFLKTSFQQLSLQQMELSSSPLECFNQLDLDKSLSFTGFSKNRSRVQSASFSQLDQQISLSFLLLASISVSNQLQAESFCRTRINLGGVLRAFHQPVLQIRVLLAAWTLMSLSLVMNTWLKTSSNTAWRRQPFRQRLSTASTLTSLSLATPAWLNPSGKKAWRSRAWRTRTSSRSFSSTACHPTSYFLAFPTTSTRTSTRSLTRTLLSIFLFSFMFNNFFYNISLESCPLGLFHGHLGQETHGLDQLDDHTQPCACQLHLSHQPFRGRKQKQPQEQLQQPSLEQNDQQQQLQLSKSVLDIELRSFFFSISFRGKETGEKNNKLAQTAFNQNLAELPVEDLVKQNFCFNDLGHYSLDKKNEHNLDSKQLPEQVPARELRHLHELCLLDGASACRRQIPKESLPKSFSKKELSQQDFYSKGIQRKRQLQLSKVQLGLSKCTAENSGRRTLEQQLQEHLPTDHQQLQYREFSQNRFQQLSLEQQRFKEKNFNNELAEKFSKRNLAKAALKQCSFRRVSEEELLQDTASRQQLAYPGSRRSLQRTASAE